ncbi:MAG: hypothetical protein QOD38_2082, partial [Acidimicrobiaceae bacterium]
MLLAGRRRPVTNDPRCPQKQTQRTSIPVTVLCKDSIRRSGNRTSVPCCGQWTLNMTSSSSSIPDPASGRDVHNHMVSATLGAMPNKRTTTRGPRSVRSPHVVAALVTHGVAPFELAVICEVFGFARPEILDPWPYELVLV